MDKICGFNVSDKSRYMLVKSQIGADLYYESKTPSASTVRIFTPYSYSGIKYTSHKLIIKSDGTNYYNKPGSGEIGRILSNGKCETFVRFSRESIQKSRKIREFLMLFKIKIKQRKIGYWI